MPCFAKTISYPIKLDCIEASSKAAWPKSTHSVSIY